MLLRFTKMHGLGNDFMVVDGVTQKIFFSPELIKKLADRHFGIGFDQLLLVEPPFDPEVDFHYRIFNADGSEVQMCGNGARCFVRFVVDHNLTNKREIDVSTVSGVLHLTLNDDDTVTVNMGAPDFTPAKLPFKAEHQALSYKITLDDGVVLEHGAVSMGNPHAVTFVDDIKKIKDGNNYIVKEDGTWKVVAEDGTTFLEGKVANAEDMDNGNVIIKEKGKYSVINTNTDVKIPADYSGIAYLFDDKYVAIKDGKYGVININNEEIVSFKYENITYNKTTEYLKAKNEDGTIDYMTKDFSVKLTAGDEILLNGFIAIKNGDDLKYYNYKLEEKSNKDVYTANTLFITKENGKYGFIDKDGKVIVEAKYDDAREQNDYGFVAVKKDGKWGSIDQYGKVVIEPTYVIKNEENIDFVGRWHNCADNNADFYSDLNDLE